MVALLVCLVLLLPLSSVGQSAAAGLLHTFTRCQWRHNKLLKLIRRHFVVTVIVAVAVAFSSRFCDS